MERVYFFIFVIAGLITIAGSILNWDWFFESRKVRIINSLFGRTAARVFYIIIGVIIITIAFSFI